MDAKYLSLAIDDFKKRFPDHESCLKFLAKKKWGAGFKCHRCGHKHCCNGIRKYVKQCTKCRYKESPTANTLFHKVKIKLDKAFFIVYFVATNKKGISSTELSRKLQISQRSCWLFRMKTIQATESKGNVGLSGDVELHDFNVELISILQEDIVVRRFQRVCIGVEKKGKGVSHIYGKCISDRSFSEYATFVKDSICNDTSIECNKWPGFDPLEHQFQIVKRIHFKDGKKGDLAMAKRMERTLLEWLKGMHNRVEFLQYYLNEYCYRFNRNRYKAEIFDHLLNRMIEHGPRTYKDIIAYPHTWKTA